MSNRDENGNLKMRMRYVCNVCGHIHDSYWKDFTECFNTECSSTDIKKISLEEKIKNKRK